MDALPRVDLPQALEGYLFNCQSRRCSNGDDLTHLPPVQQDLNPSEDRYMRYHMLRASRHNDEADYQIELFVVVREASMDINSTES